MSPLLETKIQELEQIRQNLLSNTDCSDGLVKAYQQMAIEIVEACQEALRAVLNAEFRETEPLNERRKSGEKPES